MGRKIQIGTGGWTRRLLLSHSLFCFCWLSSFGFSFSRSLALALLHDQHLLACFFFLVLVFDNWLQIRSLFVGLFLPLSLSDSFVGFTWHLVGIQGPKGSNSNLFFLFQIIAGVMVGGGCHSLIRSPFRSLSILFWGAGLSYSVQEKKKGEGRGGAFSFSVSPSIHECGYNRFTLSLSFLVMFLAPGDLIKNTINSTLCFVPSLYDSVGEIPFYAYSGTETHTSSLSPLLKIRVFGTFVALSLLLLL